MNKLHLLWKTLIVLIVLSLSINIFDFIGVTKIKVINGLTEQPLQNIDIFQNISGRISKGPGGTDGYQIRYLEETTNSDGIVSFPAKLHIHIPIGKWFKGEYIIVNSHNRTRNFNDNYFSDSQEFGALSHLMPFKYKTIRLMPYVDDLSECEDNQKCILLNAEDLAFLNNDESYCRYFFEYKLKDDRFKFTGDTCYSIIALSKLDVNLCNNVNNDIIKNTCLIRVNEKWGKEACANYYSYNDRRFRACENLLEKYGCRRSSANCFEEYNQFR
ncbi:hypothetical protein L6267_01765 [Candidatus Parcubacteria bacterium]|nr:hypothetical protein [Candidatus Parcubacteria bacterium]